MKKALLCLLLVMAVTFSFSFFGTADFAAAETPYESGTYNARGDITVYANLSIGGEQALFSIPETYYFNIIDKDGDNKYFITYNNISASAGCYIKADESSFAELTAAETDNITGFTAELVLSGDSIEFYENNSLRIKEALPYAAADVTKVQFLGFATYNSTACAYVKLNDEKQGFMPVEGLKIKSDNTALSEYVIPDNPNYSDVPDNGTTDNKASGGIDNSKLIRIILIVGIVVPALVIMFLLFKPSKKNHYDYDRNRDYNMGSSPYDAPRSRYRDDYYDDRRQPSRGRRDDYDDDDRYYDNRRY